MCLKFFCFVQDNGFLKSTRLQKVFLVYCILFFSAASVDSFVVLLHRQPTIRDATKTVVGLMIQQESNLNCGSPP